MERKSQSVNRKKIKINNEFLFFSLLGNWEAAYKDFCKAQLSDFDEDVQTWCKEVEANVCLFRPFDLLCVLFV